MKEMPIGEERYNLQSPEFMQRGRPTVGCVGHISSVASIRGWHEFRCHVKYYLPFHAQGNRYGGLQPGSKFGRSDGKIFRLVYMTIQVPDVSFAAFICPKGIAFNTESRPQLW